MNVTKELINSVKDKIYKLLEVKEISLYDDNLLTGILIDDLLGEISDFNKMKKCDCAVNHILKEWEENKKLKDKLKKFFQWIRDNRYDSRLYKVTEKNDASISSCWTDTKTLVETFEEYFPEVRE